MGHYFRLVNQSLPETIASLNEKVHSSCGNAMDLLKGKSAANTKSTQQQESHTHTLDATAIPLQESSDCSISDMMETSSPAHSGETVSDTEESSTKCTSCKVLHKTLLDIVKKMNHMQQKIDSQERLIQESLGPGKLEGTIKKQLGAFIHVILVERKFNQIPVVQLNKRHHPLQAISQHNNGQQLLDNSNTTTRLHQRIKPNTLRLHQ